MIFAIQHPKDGLTLFDRLKYYDKIKNDHKFKAKVSAQKKIYYQNKKKEILLEIVL